MSRYNKNKKKSNQIDIKRYSLAKLGNNAVDPLDVCDFWLFALWSKQHGATQDNTLVLREGQRSGFVRIFIRISRCTVLHQSDNTAPKFLSRCCRHRRRSTILRSLCHGVCVCVCVETIPNIWNGTMFGDLDWPPNASRRFVSISWASCFILACVILYWCLLWPHGYVSTIKWKPLIGMTWNLAQ